MLYWSKRRPAVEDDEIAIIRGFEHVAALGIDRDDVRIAGERRRAERQDSSADSSTETGPTVPLANAPAPTASEFSRIGVDADVFARNFDAGDDACCGPDRCRT